MFGEVRNREGAMPRKLALMAAAIAALAAPAFPAAAADIVPHEAVYTVGLVAAPGAQAFAEVQGGMKGSVEAACEGWLTKERSWIAILTPAGAPVTIATDYSAWQSPDGLAYRFVMRDRLGNAEKAFEGWAGMKPGGPGEARFTAPEARTLPLPAGTLFPLGFSRFLIERARAGDRRAEALLFDGGDGMGAKRAVAFIGRARPPDPRHVEMFGSLANGPVWPLRIAYFAAASGDATPLYEIEVLLMANGVAAQMRWELGETKLRFDLSALQELPRPACR
jgi:hypothetical protein